MEEFSWLAVTFLVLHWSAVVAFSIRVIMRRRPVGVLLAWIAMILSVPILGILLYLFIGENRISSTYLRRGQAIREQYEEWRSSLCAEVQNEQTIVNAEALPIQRQSQSMAGFPAMGGNRLQLLTHYEPIFNAIINDIGQSRSSCHLEFYIWNAGGLADRLEEALIEAAGRGVACRLLLDAVGSKPFLRSQAMKRLRDAGVEIGAVLPVGVFSALFSRADLRNHRKAVVIDGEIGYTGSQNLVDPRYFKQDSGVGQWVDAMIRVEGPVVEALAGTFIQDWEIATGTGYRYFRESRDLECFEHRGNAVTQLVPSGPQPRPLAILQLVLSTIYAARRELIITTPYFVPDESVLTALMSAAHSGVEVTLILPEKNDSVLADYASRAVFDDLLAAGVKIAGFRGGLLHTKSITVDGKFCLFGSVNLDMRSLWLNFELSVFVYDVPMTSEIRALQLEYLGSSVMVDEDARGNLSVTRRFLENAAHLVAPLL
jgi:cardiolipin synthase